VRRKSAADRLETAAPDIGDAVICVYHRERDEGWLAPFLASLRAAGFAGSIHCIGTLEADELAVLGRHGAVAHRVDPVGGIDVDNVAHVHLSRVLDALAADETRRPDQVLVTDTVRAGFLRDPFLSKTIGLSAFCEGPARIGDSDYNVYRLRHFAEIDDAWLQRPIVSSALLRGPLDVVREFYRRLFGEFVGRRDLMQIQKVIQGAFNKLCQDGELGFPVILHPNGAEVYFEIWPQSLTFDIRLGVRVGGAVPAIVVNPFHETPLMQMLKGSLSLASVLAPT
jgi:hypothetical protein